MYLRLLYEWINRGVGVKIWTRQKLKSNRFSHITKRVSFPLTRFLHYLFFLFSFLLSLFVFSFDSLFFITALFIFSFCSYLLITLTLSLVFFMSFPFLIILLYSLYRSHFLFPPHLFFSQFSISFLPVHKIFWDWYTEIDDRMYDNRERDMDGYFCFLKEICLLNSTFPQKISSATRGLNF